MLLYVLTLITAAAAALTQPMQRHRLPAPQPLRVRLRLFPSMRTAAPAMSAPTDGDALQVPSDPSTSHATLGPLVTATARLVRESTGKGGESSGSGRPEWGTWADTDLFDAVLTGKVKIEIQQRYPLAEAARAHHDLEARRTTGSTVLIP